MSFLRNFELKYNSPLAIIANILWFIFAPGFLMAILYVIASISLFITIIGIPFGWEILKLARLSLWPFGYKVKTKESESKTLSVVMNVIWLIFGGIWLAALHAILGVLWLVTIIGIPFGVQHFKLAYLALLPFGKKIKPQKKVEKRAAQPVTTV